MLGFFKVHSRHIALLASVVGLHLQAGDVPRSLTPFGATVQTSEHAYYWKAQPVENSAQLVTLFLHSGNSTEDVPVLSLLRDTLGDSASDNDRLTSVWMLGYSPLTPMKRAFAAIPFFYWRIGQGGASTSPKHVKPFVDLTSAQRPLVYGVSRNILQWAMLDPMATPIRATSRAYRTNEVDHERLHLEEAIGYLRHAPAGESQSRLTQPEIDSVIARLELSKKLLGGLVNRRELSDLGQAGRFDEERVRSRNWELLRQTAERTGLFFEPLPLTGTDKEYAVLWFCPQATEPTGVPHKALWKLLNIRDPWTDDRLKSWKGTTSVHALDADGALLPQGEHGDRNVTLIPLGAYSMDYPRMPLLLVDFRDSLHIRRHEMTQRAINEVTSGVIGISHFTNWYFYVAADAYDFVAARHGGAVDQAERLDSYSRFRVALALDEDVSGSLRTEMQRLVNAMAVNPLETSPSKELETAEAKYSLLEQQAQDGQLAHLLDKRRRSELASFGKTQGQLAWQSVLHVVSFGAYTDRVRPAPGNLDALSEDRRLDTNLTFLECVDSAGTAPEVAYDQTRLQDALRMVSSASPRALSPALQAHAQQVIRRFQSLTGDSVLLEDCRLALRRIDGASQELAVNTRVRPASNPPESGE